VGLHRVRTPAPNSGTDALRSFAFAPSGPRPSGQPVCEAKSASIARRRWNADGIVAQVRVPRGQGDPARPQVKCTQGDRRPWAGARLRLCVDRKEGRPVGQMPDWGFGRKLRGKKKAGHKADSLCAFKLFGILYLSLFWRRSPGTPPPVSLRALTGAIFESAAAQHRATLRAHKRRVAKKRHVGLSHKRAGKTRTLASGSFSGRHRPAKQLCVVLGRARQVGGLWRDSARG